MFLETLQKSKVTVKRKLALTLSLTVYQMQCKNLISKLKCTVNHTIKIMTQLTAEMYQVV